jgi:hypothetical protein
LRICALNLGASVALLLDGAGQLPTDCGWHGDFDINVFLALLGYEMSVANVVVHLSRDEAAFDLHFRLAKFLTRRRLVQRMLQCPPPRLPQILAVPIAC